MARIALVNVFEFSDIAALRALYGAGEVPSLGAPPLGLLSLAAALRGRGHDVHLVDWRRPILAGELRLDEHLCREAALYLRRLRADVVGFTSRCDTYGHTLATMRHHRELDPNCVLVLGGPQATITALETLTHFPFVDLVIRHEGEVTFPALVQALADGTPYADLPGLAYRSERGPKLGPDPAVIRELDALPVPAYDLYPPEHGEAYVEVGRGCPFQCTFCSTSTFFKRTYRVKSPGRILGEVRLLASRYGARSFHFIHDMFTADRKRILRICDELVRAALGVVWGCSARLDCLSPDLLDAMHAAGCRQLFLGIESGSPRVQRLVNKHLDLRQLRPTLEHCRRLGIRTRASFIVGFPEETLADVEQTLGMGLDCARFGAEFSQLHLLSPYPGTPLTVANASRLTFTGYLNDFSSTEGPPDAEVDGYARAHPAIFSNHYQVVPRHFPLEAVLGLDLFTLPLNFLRHALGALVKESDSDTLYGLFRGAQRDLLGVRRDRSRIDQTRLSVGIVADLLNSRILASKGALPGTREALRYDLAMTLLGFALPTYRAIEHDRAPCAGDVNALVPRLSSPCVLLEMRCTVDALKTWIAGDDAPNPHLADRSDWTALFWGMEHREGARVKRGHVREDDRRLLSDCTGRDSLFDLASRAWRRRDVPEAASLDEAISVVTQKLMTLTEMGVVALHAPGDVPRARSPGVWTLPGPEQEWITFSALALLRGASIG